MTYKQLYGPCDALIHGGSTEEMVAKGDTLHIEAMNATLIFFNKTQSVMLVPIDK